MIHNEPPILSRHLPTQTIELDSLRMAGLFAEVLHHFVKKLGVQTFSNLLNLTGAEINNTFLQRN